MVIEAQALHGFPSKHPVVHELYWQHPGKRFVRAIGSEDPDYIGRWRMYDGVREWPRGGRVRRLMPDYVMGPRRANAVATLVTQGKAELRGRETMLGIETQVVDLAGHSRGPFRPAVEGGAQAPAPNRSIRNRLRSKGGVRSIARSAMISPTTLQNLNPCPEKPAAIDTWG